MCTDEEMNHREQCKTKDDFLRLSSELSRRIAECKQSLVLVPINPGVGTTLMSAGQPGSNFLTLIVKAVILIHTRMASFY